MKYFPISTLLIIVASAVLTVGMWSTFNKPHMEPPWPERLNGIAFSPYHSDQDGVIGPMPTVQEIDTDLKFLSDKTQNIRTYTTEGVFSEIPRLSSVHKLNVSVGAWIDERLDHNEQEITQAIKLAKDHNVVNVIIGNEVILRNDISLPRLFSYLDRVRDNISQPISTSETWSNWIKYPELAEHVDFIAVHILPYWEGLDVKEAVSFVRDRVLQLEKRFPDKPVVITEVGWPSEGRTRNNAVASASNEALFLRRFLKLAEEESYDYYLMEAFDQPWKRKTEGAVGAYWGIYDVERQPKFPFNGPIVNIPEWQILASISITIGMMLLIPFYAGSNTINAKGKIFFTFIVYGLITLATLLIYNYLSNYMTLMGIIVGTLLFVFMLSIIILFLTETHEWIEAYWINYRRRLHPNSNGEQKNYPKVSIHVPAYNEPPDMLIATLNALAVLDYPNYEVLVIDNNTKDPGVWRPIENHCRTLGDRFKFYHVDKLSGYKAGALNFALRHTCKDSEILAFIDSDYIVDIDWLRNLVPIFEDSKIAIVQAPQDYRDGRNNAFKAMCYAEYRGFFHIGMVTRNDRNAIIQHGTMVIIRRDTLESVGGWAEWCITEDAELGLRVFEYGLEASYTSKSYGRGLMPDTFIDYKKQRYRWAYGAVQIIKKHLGELLCMKNSCLSIGQRYHFITGWLPWLAESANLGFSILAIVWSAGMMYAPELFEVPSMAFSVLPIIFFGFKLIKFFHLYRQKLGVSFAQTFAAAIAGLSLSHTIGKAVFYGLITDNQPFIRTPKQASPHAVSTVVASAFEEILLFMALLLAIFTLNALPRVNSPDFSLWIVLLVIQSIPYAATLITSLISVCLLPAHFFGLDEPDNSHYSTETNKS